MPRIFSDKDRELLRQRLMDAGREAIERQGLKKTTVDELVRVVGIAKGTFYNFFPSKEALCFALLEAEEAQRKTAIASLLANTPDAATALENLMLWGFQVARESSLFHILQSRNEYGLLVRTLSPEILAAHQAQDEAELGQLLTALGINDPQRIRTTSALLRAFLLLYLHEAEIGPQVFRELEPILSKMLASHATSLAPIGGTNAN